MEINKDTLECNTSQLFVMEILRIDPMDLIKNRFLGSFFYNDEADVEYKDCLHLLFHPENYEIFYNFIEHEQSRGANILDEFDYEDGYIILVYKIPEKFIPDVEIVKLGKYSTVSKEYKSKFAAKITNGNEEFLSISRLVFDKSNILKEYWEEEFDVQFTKNQEFWRKMKKEEETFSLQKLKEYDRRKIELV